MLQRLRRQISLDYYTIPPATQAKRKYGGKRRAFTLRLEEVEKEGNEKDLEHFAELLDAIVVNLTDANQEAELGSGSLYITLQRKFNKNLLTKYKQWVCDNHRTEDVKRESQSF